MDVMFVFLPVLICQMFFCPHHDDDGRLWSGHGALQEPASQKFPESLMKEFLTAESDPNQRAGCEDPLKSVA